MGPSAHTPGRAGASQKRKSDPVRRVTEEDATRLASFFRQTWDPKASPESVLAWLQSTRDENVVDPGEIVPAFACHLNDEIIGYLGTIPVRFWDGEREHPGHWMKGFWVVEEYRGGPIGFKLLQRATEELGLCGVMTVAPPSVRLFAATGFQDLGVIPNQVSVVRPGPLLAGVNPTQLKKAGAPSWAVRTFKVLRACGVTRLLGVTANVGWTLLDRLPSKAVGLTTARIHLDEVPTESLDALWRSMQSGVDASMVRDAAYLRTRFATREGDPYVGLVAKKGDILCGLAVVRKPTSIDASTKVRVAVLADMVVDPADEQAIKLLLRSARGEARRQEADLLVVSGPHPALAHHLRLPHFLTRPGNVHLMIRDADQSTSLRMELGAWWSMRGDAGSDEGL